MRVTRGRILVIRGGAIGDFILTLPAMAALRGQFPEAHLEVLGYPHIAQLAQYGGLVDRVQPIEARGLAGFFARRGVLDPATADYFARFDIIVSYLFDPDDIFRTNVAACSRAQFLQGPHRPKESGQEHATKVYLKPLERLAIFDADPVPRLIKQTVAAAGNACERGLIAAHPGSGSERKNWPEASWEALLARVLAESPNDVLLVGGEAEGDRLERLAARLSTPRVRLARSLPLAELAGLLRFCAAFVGHDSGITHLAAALAVPTLALWGHTTEAVWRPQGKRVIIARAEGGLARLPVEQVWQALGVLLQGAAV
ncbi:MAG TPA: glycosyltransferase family 9 protein [Verrucomicrobiae bacterium]|nr:glycosyltransferase family 9 protein [Verrucomicrobiae bacterium]